MLGRQGVAEVTGAHDRVRQRGSGNLVVCDPLVDVSLKSAMSILVRIRLGQGSHCGAVIVIARQGGLDSNSAPCTSSSIEEKL